MGMAHTSLYSFEKRLMITKVFVPLLKITAKNWLAVLVFSLALCGLAQGTPLWAAAGREINQTVPPVTPTPLPTPVPPATATSAPPSAPPSSGSGGQQASSPAKTSTPQPAQANKLTGSVKSKTLNVRSGPGTGYLIIGVLKLGDNLEVLEQNAKGDWWRVCCLPGTDVRGWVSSSFITPDFDVAEAQRLLPVATNVPAAPTPTQTVVPTETPGTVAEAAAPAPEVSAPVSDTAITVDFVQSPAFPLQGMLVTMLVTVTNPSGIDAFDVELRDELPQGLSIVNVSAVDTAIVQKDVTENLREVYSVVWPKLAPAEIVTATAHLRVDPELGNGMVLDNLVFAGASNLPGSTNGISFGMPPQTLPDFQ